MLEACDAPLDDGPNMLSRVPDIVVNIAHRFTIKELATAPLAGTIAV
jgi:hypothetical protein